MKKALILEAILITIFCLLIWFVGSDIQIRNWIPLSRISIRLAFIGLVVLAWVLKIFLKHYLSIRAEKKLAVSFLEYSLKNIEAKDIHAENLKLQMQQLIQDIKNWQVLSGKKRIPLHDLPWFLVIGPRHNGKTALLRYLSSTFSLLRTKEHQEITKTPGAQWFAMEKAVFLKYSQFQEEEAWDSKSNHAAWLAILKTLKKYKRGSPVNGMILTLDIADFFKPSVEQEEKIANLRTYIQDLHELIKVPFPVYFVATRCDEITGFLEYFGRWNASEREQIVGFTLANSLTEDNFKNTLTEKYSEFVSQLRDRLVQSLEQEQNLQLRQNLCFFPEQLALLQQNIVEVLTAIFIPNKLFELVDVRGFYLTSAFAEPSTKCDLVSTLIQQEFGLETKEDFEATTETSGFFIKQLFQDLILSEAWMVETRSRFYHLKKYGHAILSLFTILALLGGMSALSGGYFYNKQRAFKAKKYVEKFVINAPLDKSLTIKEALLQWEPLRNALNVYENDTKRWLLSYKIYQSPAIEKKLSLTFKDQLQLWLLPRIFEQLEILLENEPTMEMSDDFIKGYLALYYPQALPSRWVVEAAKLMWTKDPELTLDDVNQLVQDLEFSLEGTLQGFEPSEALIKKIEAYLKKRPIADKVYEILKIKMKGEPAIPLNLLNVLNIEHSLFETGSEALIPQYYTKQGLVTLYSPGLLTAIREMEQDYVLMEAALGIKLTIESTDGIIHAVNERYSEESINHWESALVNLKFKAFNSLEEAVMGMEFLVGAHSPFHHLLEILRENVQPLLSLNKNVELGSVLKPLYALSQPENAGQKSTGALFKSLETFMKAIKSIKDTDDIQLASFKMTKNVMLENNPNPIEALMQEAKSLPRPFQEWVETIGVSTWQILMQNTTQYLNARWQEEVLLPYEKVKGYFPFDGQSEISVGIETFGEFFAGEGIIKQFINKYLRAYLEQKASGWEWKELYNETISNSETAAQLERLMQVNQRFYAGEHPLIGVDFFLTPLNLSANAASVQLKIGSEEILYRHGPQQAILFKWQPSVQNERVVLNFRDFSGQNTTKVLEGAWALFKLMQMGSLEFEGELGAYRLKINLGEHEAQFLLQMMDAKGSFKEMVEDLRFLEGF